MMPGKVMTSYQAVFRAVLTEASLSAAYVRRVTLVEVDGQTVCLT